MVPSVSTHRVRSAAGVAGTAVRGVAFWSAVALPFAAITLLAVGAPLSWVGLLLLGNVAAVVLGHGYASGRPNHEH